MIKIQLNNYKIIFLVIGLIGVLIFASPTIALLIQRPPNQQFSEIYMLGPTHLFDQLPFNITAGTTNLVYLDVGNNMGHSSYYTCIVKIGNETEPLPNTTTGVASTLPISFEYKPFIHNGETWEAPLTFQVNTLQFENGASQLSEITINGQKLLLNETSNYDSEKTGYYYNLIVELWIYNSTLGTSQFDNRFVSLIMNMTQ